MTRSIPARARRPPSISSPASARARCRKASRLPGTPAYRSAWRETIKAADEANEPGRFTAFIGYEWTSNAGGNNLHRNVIWRDNGAKASLVEPFTTLPPLGSPNPRDLWKWMADYRREDRRRNPRHRAQRQSEQRPHVPDHRVVHRQADRPRICREPRALGAALRGHADQGRRRDASVPVAQRRIRELRALGQGQPRPHRSQEAGDAGIRVRPLGAQERPQDGSRARRESLQVRPGRQHRRAHRPRRRRGGQFLRQDVVLRTERGPRNASLRQDGQGRHHGLGADRVRLCRRVGDREHARGDLRRHEAPRDLRHHRPAHDRALLRRLGFRAERREQPHAGQGRLHQGRADGRRPERRAAGQGADASSSPR